MCTSIIFTALLVANVLAKPWIEHAGSHRHHHKRDQEIDYIVDNVLVEEYIIYVTACPDSAPAFTPAPVLPEKVAVAVTSSVVPAEKKVNEKVAEHHPHVHYPPEYTAAPMPSSTAAMVVVPAPSAVATSAAAVESTPSGTYSAPDTFWSSSPLSPITGVSGSTDVLTSANTWRKKWLSSPSTLVDFEWNSTLAKNSYLTATGPIFTTTDPKTGQLVYHNEYYATQMNHNLNPGSMAQCEDTGVGNAMMNATAQRMTGISITPFEQAWLMWMCEEPLATIQEVCKQLGFNNQGNSAETGHAEIIKSASYTQMGCYYMNATNPDGTPYHDANVPSNWLGIWTCDFA